MDAVSPNGNLDRSKFLINDYSNFSLVSDIGGTKTLLSVFGRRHDGKIQHIFTLMWKSAGIKSLIACINEALKFAYDEYRISAEGMRAVFGVAGPIGEKRRYAKPTNLEWHVDADEIRKNSYLKDIVLINDFEAAGYGVDLLGADGIIQLNDAIGDSIGTAAIIGAGTGLGMAILSYDRQKRSHVPIASEGGHIAMPAIDPLEQKIIRFVMKKNNMDVTPGFEPFVSGPGLANIYDYFASKRIREGQIHKEIESSSDKAAIISKHCRTDEVCRDAMDTFLRFYGRAASCLALMSCAKGGIYIAGGIAPKIAEELQNGIFIEEFEMNYRMRELLKEIPVYLVMDPDVGSLGAANAAFNFFDELVR